MPLIRRRTLRHCTLWLAGLVWCGLAVAVEAPSATGPAAAQPEPDLFTSEQRQWIAENPVVRVLSDAGSPPFDFLAADGSHQGLYSDYLAELSLITGLRFEWSEQSRRDQLVTAAQGGQGQLLIGFAVPVPAQGFIAVPRALAQDYPVFVTRRDGGGFAAPTAERQRVSLVRGYGPAQDYASRTTAGQLLNSEGFEPSLVDVAVGRADVSVQSLAVADYLIRSRGLAGLQIDGAYDASQGEDLPVHWWVPEKSAPLAGILKTAFDKLPPQRHRTLRARWINPSLTDSQAAATLVALSPEDHLLPLAVLLITLLLVGLLLALLLVAGRRLRLARQGSQQMAHSRRGRERVLDQSPALLFEMEQSASGEVVVRYASSEARRLFSIDIDEETLPIEAFLRTIYPEDQAWVMAAIQRSADDRTELEQEYRVLSPQGLRWVKSIIRPLQQEGGAIAWSGITVDIGAQKRAEQHGEQTEQRLREIADNVPGVVFQVQRDLAGSYRLNFSSASLYSVRGVRPEDFNRGGDAFFDSILDEDRAAVQEKLERSAQTLEPLEAEYRIRMPDGKIEWMAATAVTNRAHDGTVLWNGYISNLSRLKKAELDLQAAQKFLRDLTDGVPGFIYQLRRDSPNSINRLSFVSAGVSSHGVSADEALQDASRLYLPIESDDAAKLVSAIERSYASLSPFRVDYRLRLPTGLTAWMRTQAVPTRDAEGAVMWNGMTFNISEEKLRESQARRAEERLSRLTNALPGAVFQLACTPGGEWVYTYLSEGAQQVYQLAPDQVLRDANTLHQMFFAEDWRRLEMALSESIHSGAEVQRECRSRRADGSLRWLSILARPQGADGELFLWNGFAQDVTEEKEASQQAEVLQRRLREVTENVPCTVFQLQRDFEDELSARFVSENIYALVGITREELIEDIKRLVDRIVHEDLPVMFNALETARQEQRPVVFDFRLRDTAQSLRWIRGSVSTPRVEDGGLLWNGAWLDITDIKELEASLASASQVADGANRLKSEFLATMSHEIRTPMNAIIGLGQLMQQTVLTSAQRGYLDKINTASQSLLSILNDILDHSKIEAGKMSLERTEFDLNTVLDGLSAVTHLKAVEKDLELRFEVPTNLPMRLVGDPLRLGQVLLNLTSNAIKFSERGTVVVSVAEVARSDNKLRLAFQVSDQGIGLSAAQIDNLFQSFAQGDASTTRKYGGTGLGLSIARNLIRLMEGDIQVQSAPGVGSTFRFEIAVEVSDEPQPHYGLPRDLYGLKALVVDDNSETRAAIEGWLQAFGCEVAGVESGLAALERLQNDGGGYALVVLDWRMPDLNGVETATRIRALPLTTQPALLMATAYVNEELVRQCESIGLKDFMAKPFSPSALYNTLLSALGRSEASTPHAEALTVLAGLRVLVADDNDINLEIVTAILESAGAAVRLAHDGEEVLSRLNESEFDLVLLDLQMPKLDGLEAARRLRADARFAHLPLVAMTAHAMPTHREASQLAGFNAHLLKPIDRRELLDTLVRHQPGGAGLLSAVGAEAEPAASTAPESSGRLHGSAFDRASALQRLGGNQALLDRLLARFVNDHSDAAQQIIAAIESGDSPRAAREAHTLKGVAANLGAVLLASTAGAVEATLRQGEVVQGLTLDLLRIHQQEMLRAIAEMGVAGTSLEVQPEISAEALQQLVAELRGLLLTHDADAKDAFEALQQRLPGVPGPSMLRLRAAVETYEFDTAASALQDVLRDLNLST